MISVTRMLDFDGTLFDTRKTVLDSLWMTLDKSVAREQLEFTGEPLRAFISRYVSGRDLERKVSQFKQIYDELCVFCDPYPGVISAFSSPEFRKSILIVTNKRADIVKRILLHQLADGVDDITIVGPETNKSKFERVIDLENRGLVEVADTCFVLGDGYDDMILADKRCIPFFWAAYGYGSSEIGESDPRVAEVVRAFEDIV